MGSRRISALYRIVVIVSITVGLPFVAYMHFANVRYPVAWTRHPPPPPRYPQPVLAATLTTQYPIAAKRSKAKWLFPGKPTISSSLPVIPRPVAKPCSPHTPNEAPCSHHVYRQYFRACRELPSVGNWTKVWEYSRGGTVFTTPLCKLLPPHNLSTHLADHLQSTRTKRVLMVGDSHGFRYFGAFRELLHMSGYHCRITRQEKDPKTMVHYLAENWGVSETAFIRLKRGCYSCLCTLLHCRHNTSGHDIEVEFLGMVLTTDYILPNQSTCKRTNYTFCAAKSEYELIFKYYAAKRIPDIVIVSTTSSHDFKMKKNGVPSVDTVLQSYKALKSLLANLNPKVTMWITTVFQRHQHYMNGEIHEFNKALFKLLEMDLVLEEAQPLTMIGFDHTVTAKPLSTMTWSHDRIHYHPSFYLAVMTELLTQFSTSNIQS